MKIQSGYSLSQLLPCASILKSFMYLLISRQVPALGRNLRVVNAGRVLIIGLVGQNPNLL